MTSAAALPPSEARLALRRSVERDPELERDHVLLEAREHLAVDVDVPGLAVVVVDAGARAPIVTRVPSSSLVQPFDSTPSSTCWFSVPPSFKKPENEPWRSSPEQSSQSAETDADP
jgi:hypothetical protein